MIAIKLTGPAGQQEGGGGKSTGIEPSLEWAGGNIWPDDLIVVLVAQFVIAKRLDHAAIGCELPLATADDP